ncbi:unnamed protein product [Moneuplotes crassus]|uniref:Anaphase-promoting complex subunit 4-like WD40 domain-containing protein n=1 Tax=Euplotes crassus TaxID=5936 RepID=A0AAD1UIE9_EUPCR|nr:unnamed protein product [Moneuplotes crassus]
MSTQEFLESMKKSHQRMDTIKKNFESWRPLAGIAYDYFYPHSLKWSASCCKWGNVIAENETMIRQEVIFGSRTDGSYNKTTNTWDGVCSLIVLGEVDIPKQGYKIPKRLDSISSDLEESKRRISVSKVISHPYEINCLKPWPANRKIVCSHTDSKDVYLWDLFYQENTEYKENVVANTPDLILKGHTDIACYALDWHKNKPLVASGGRDKCVLLWDLEQYFGCNTIIHGDKQIQQTYMKHLEDSKDEESCEETNTRVVPKKLQSYLKDMRESNNLSSETVHADIELRGHTENVEDICFHPVSETQLCSSSQDQTIMLWDTKSGCSPVMKIDEIHSDDINCVDWNPHDHNLLLAGSSDHSVSLIDIRNGKCINYFDQHKSEVSYVQWSPFKENIFASSGDSLMIWDLKRQGEELMFHHCGHVGPIVDFDWNFEDEWSMMSTSEDSDSIVMHDEGSFQLYRPLDLIVGDNEYTEAE